MAKTKIEFVELNPKQMWEMKMILEKALKKSFGNKCMYCKKIIKKGDKFSIFNKPDRIVCNNILCLTECIAEDE